MAARTQTDPLPTTPCTPVRVARALPSDPPLTGLDLQAFADALPNMAWVASADGSVRWFNRRFYEYTGLDPVQALSSGWAPVYHPDDRARIARSWERAVGEQRAFADEARMRAADGTYRWFMVSAMPMFEHGRLHAWSGTSTDIEERKQAQVALEDSEARFRGLADNMIQLAWIATGNGEIFWYNRRWYEYTGTTLEQVRGTGWEAVHHPEHLPRVRERVRQCMASGTAWEDTFPLRGADGSYRWFLSRAEPVRDVPGGVVRWFGTNTDVTEQRETLQALRESEERLVAAMAQARMGSYDIDLRTGEVRWDARMAALCGLRDPVREVRFAELLEAMHGGDRGRLLARLEAVPALARENFDSEIRVTGIDDGVRRWLQVQGCVHREDGVATRIVGRGLDTSARRAAERANASLLARERENSERLRALALASVKINAAARFGTVVEVATQEARLLIPSHQALGASWMEGEPGLVSSHRSLSGKYAASLEAGAPPSGPSGLWALVREDQQVLRLGVAELEARQQSEQWRGLEDWQPALRGLLAAPLTGREGRSVGLILLSERQVGEFGADDEAILVQLASVATVALENSRSYTALREADRRKDEFLATLAHELRNPLAPIRSTLELLHIKHDEDALRAGLPLLDRQVSHMVRLVDDLFEVSRITRGAFELKRERLELAGVLRLALETARPRLAAARHRIVVELPGEPLPMDADGLRLAQVFTNLLNNAAKYTPDGGEVRISARREGDVAAVVVADTGIGIAAEMMPRIFDIFAQVDRKLRGSSDGLGIGLSIVKRLVELHGGSVCARSAGPGRGSELEVRLPLATLPAAGAQVATPDRLALPSPIMVVDDNRDAADTLATLLGLLGSRATAVYDGASALAVLATLHPAVALLDIGMPGMDGFELAKRIRAHEGGARVRLIALSGWRQDSDPQRLAEAGFDGALVKPLNLDALQSELLRTSPAHVLHR